MIHKNAIAGLVLLVTSASTLGAQSRRTVAEMEPVLVRIAAFRDGQSREDMTRFLEFVMDCQGSPAQLRPLEDRLLRFLQSDATAAGKYFVFEQLSLIATNAAIPVVAPMLTRPDTAEQARYVLARIPGPAADEALRNGLAGTRGKVKIGIVNSLGQRRDARAVGLLSGLISLSDAELTAAAVAALGRIGDRPALDALGAARNKASHPQGDSKVPSALQDRVSEAYATCADQLARRGDKAAAVKVYRELIALKESPTVRVHALAGLAAAEGKSAIPALTAAIEGKDPRVQTAALAFLAGIPGPETTSALVAVFPKLPVAGQVRVLAALVDRSAASSKPLVAAALKSPAAELRAAGLDALGRLGDESSVKVLAEAAAAGQGSEQSAARQSLYGMRGLGIDAAIVAAISSASGKVKVELIMAARERGASAAADAVAGTLQDEDPAVRREALRALRTVGGTSHVQTLVDFVLKAGDSPDRREAAQALAAIVKTSEPLRISAVVAAYWRSSVVAPRLSLLEVMGQSSSEEALPTLRSSLKDTNPELARAGILALSLWETPAPLADLLAVARISPDPALKVLALRGYIKLVAVPSQRSAPESARMLTEAMGLAVEPAEKRSILALLPAYPCNESVQLAESLLRDEVVAKEAKVALDRTRVATSLMQKQ